MKVFKYQSYRGVGVDIRYINSQNCGIDMKSGAIFNARDAEEESNGKKNN
jgi:hypothetical protein